MRSPQADKFFRRLSKERDEPVLVIITGAVAGAIFGHVRSSADIDFSIEFKRKRTSNVSEADLDAALRRTSEATGINIQYAKDIDRWGLISLLDYKRKAVPYRKFGAIEVRTLAPLYWCIGKFSRYLQSDILDLAVVLKRKRVPANQLSEILGRALKQSPLSSHCFQFRKHVEQFFSEHGEEIWGARFDPALSIRTFHKQAGISPRAVK